MKLKTKIQVYAVFILIVFVAGTNFFVYLIYENSSWASEGERLVSQSAVIAESIQQAQESQIELREVFRSYVPANGMVRIINQEEETILTAASGEQPETNFPVQFRDGQDVVTRTTEGGGRYVFAYRPLIWEDGSVVSLEVSERLIGMEENMALLRFILVGASLFVLLPAVVGGRLLGAVILRPVNSLIRTMNTIQAKGSFERIQRKRYSRDELDQLGKTFNQMIDRLESQFRKQEQFVSDASHELRTPLTIIEGYTSLLQRRGSSDPEVVEEAVEAIHAESTRMKHLTEQLLVLAKDDQHLQLNFTEVNIGALVHETVRAMTAATKRTITMDQPQENFSTVADKEKLKQVLYVLLDNAVKYSDEAIEVRIESSDENVEIKVKDYGGGISAEDQDRIFDRFYRVDKARSREKGGAGLGLTIASHLMQVQGGKLSLESKQGDYSIFTITLPLVE